MTGQLFATEWEHVGDTWKRADGALISKVNPRGKVLYALQLPGTRRPEWFDTLDDAKRAS